jgi:hypothetical protein
VLSQHEPAMQVWLLEQQAPPQRACGQLPPVPLVFPLLLPVVLPEPPPHATPNVSAAKSPNRRMVPLSLPKCYPTNTTGYGILSRLSPGYLLAGAQRAGHPRPEAPGSERPQAEASSGGDPSSTCGESRCRATLPSAARGGSYVLDLYDCPDRGRVARLHPGALPPGLANPEEEGWAAERAPSSLSCGCCPTHVLAFDRSTHDGRGGAPCARF